MRQASDALDTAVRRYADGIAAEHCPRLADPAAWLDRRFLDLKAACDQAGEAGDAILAAAVRVFDDASKAVADYRGSGSVEAWASCRDRVLKDLDTISAAGGARPAVEVCRSAPPAAPAPPQSPAERIVREHNGGEKGSYKQKPLRRVRPGSGRPNGRPSKDADELLEKVIRQIADEARREELDVERDLHTRVYSQTAEALCEMIRDRLRKEIAPSTLRSSSKLWARWATFRKAKGKPAAGTKAHAPVDPGAIHVGGVKRTTDERRQDAAIARWVAEAGVSLDDD